MSQHAPPHRTADPLLVAGTGAAVAVTAAGWLHLAGALAAPRVDPLAFTVSDYVALPGGYALLAVAALALGLVGVALAATARRAAPAARAVPVLLLGWSAALLLVGLFPTNPPGVPADLAAGVHRYAGALAFAVLPIAVWLLGRALRNRALCGLAVAVGVAAGTFLVAHVPIVLAIDIAGSPGFPLLGGVERVLYALVIVLLLVTARALRRTAPDLVAVPAVAEADPALVGRCPVEAGASGVAA
ncbi:MAG: hypothetical protein JWP64_2988 [Pseudonocardia sp.]|jgi:hypothetical protein|uniref:DUF998 domain-containing protein n=1 Tax=Pseudonocardia sp. TaxID=60912 RepID=UPI002637EBF7|nr:DUF998 domain-containing protein [Pseudonocardia sp.]MCU1628039.1 hypothetical protein [Pseudonocardia sp.]MDT7701254.1 hypothetical protein [Pseudonocardiales bacterium]